MFYLIEVTNYNNAQKKQKPSILMRQRTRLFQNGIPKWAEQ